MNSTLTDWFPGTVKPVHAGFYERDYTIKGLPKIFPIDYWDGEFWLAAYEGLTPSLAKSRPRCGYQELPWRGLAAPYVAPSPAAEAHHADHRRAMELLHSPPPESCLWFVLRDAAGDRVLDYPLREIGAQAEMPPEHLAMPDVEWPEPLPPVLRHELAPPFPPLGFGVSLPLPTLVHAGARGPMLAHDRPEPVDFAATLKTMTARHDRNTRRRAAAALVLIAFVLAVYAVALSRVYA